MERYPVVLPVITAASLTPREIAAGGFVTVTAAVEERTVYLEAEARYSGEFYSDEV